MSFNRALLTAARRRFGGHAGDHHGPVFGNPHSEALTARGTVPTLDPKSTTNPPFGIYHYGMVFFPIGLILAWRSESKAQAEYLNPPGTTLEEHQIATGQLDSMTKRAPKQAFLHY